MTIRLGAGAYDPLVVPGDDTRYGAQYDAAWRFLETVARLRPRVLEDLADIPLAVGDWDPASVVGVATPYGWRSYTRYVEFISDMRTWAVGHGLGFDLAVVAGAHTRVAWASGRRPGSWEFPGTCFLVPPTALPGACPDPLQETHAQWRQRTDALWDKRVRELRVYRCRSCVLSTRRCGRRSKCGCRRRGGCISAPRRASGSGGWRTGASPSTC